MRRARGFSLIEALVALTILGVGVLALGGTLSATNRAARDSLEATIADHLARQKLETLRHTSVAGRSDGVERIRLDHVDYQRAWTVERNTPRPGLTRLDVTVSWSEYRAPLVQPLSEPVVTTDPDLELALQARGRARSRSLAAFVADR